MAKTTSRKSAKVAKKAAAERVAAKPTLLAGANPQIAKADGDAPVQAYIAAMPGWKRDVGRRLDALIVRTVPGVCKAVKWNSPLYGVEGQGWFLGFHCLTKYVKVAFFLGRSLRPVPPASPRTRTRATSTSTRTTSSTRSSWRVGLGRHRSCPAGSRSAGKDLHKQSPVFGLAQETRGTERKTHHEQERVSESEISISDDRREDKGAERLAGRDALPAPHIDQASRSRGGRGVEVERGSGVVSRRIDLHRRDLQERREDDLRQRGGSEGEGSFGPLQLQS